MVKILILYDSQTGNTEKVAKAVAEGAGSVKGVKVEVKKIGDSFPLTLLSEVDGVAFGSPSIYADITKNMKDFLEHIESYVIDVARLRALKIKIKGQKAAVFGTYGFDGAFVVEERLKIRVKMLGYTVQEKTLQMIDFEVKTNPRTLGECRDWGKAFAESLKS